MPESNEPVDTLMRRRMEALSGEGNSKASDLRYFGLFAILGSAFLFGINIYSFQEGQVWPKALVLAPSVLLLGIWLLVDATKLHLDERRHQKAILWSIIVVGSAVGFGLVYLLTGSFF